MKRSFFDLDNPFYRPLWVRVVIVAVCIGWGSIELSSANPFWATIFLATGVYLAWAFFIRKSGGKS